MEGENRRETPNVAQALVLSTRLYDDTKVIYWLAISQLNVYKRMHDTGALPRLERRATSPTRYCGLKNPTAFLWLAFRRPALWAARLWACWPRLPCVQTPPPSGRLTTRHRGFFFPTSPATRQSQQGGQKKTRKTADFFLVFSHGCQAQPGDFLFGFSSFLAEQRGFLFGHSALLGEQICRLFGSPLKSTFLSAIHHTWFIELDQPVLRLPAGFLPGIAATVVPCWLCHVQLLLAAAFLLLTWE